MTNKQLQVRRSPVVSLYISLECWDTSFCNMPKINIARVEQNVSHTSPLWLNLLLIPSWEPGEKSRLSGVLVQNWKALKNQKPSGTDVGGFVFPKPWLPPTPHDTKPGTVLSPFALLLKFSQRESFEFTSFSFKYANTLGPDKGHSQTNVNSYNGLLSPPPNPQSPAQTNPLGYFYILFILSAY